MNPNKTYKGLSAQEVLESRRRYGSNTITPKEKESLWKRFLEKFGDPLIIILLVAGSLSIAISFYEFFALDKGLSIFFEPVGIFVAVLLATGLAFIFELKADKEFDILNQVNDDTPVRVIRDGNETEVPKRDIVVGDFVRIGTGDEVPADGQLMECVSLNVDESSLTGEPICHKTTVESEFRNDATFPSNRVLRGTKVMEGDGLFIVTEVGDATENGKVMEAVQIDASVRTPLNEQLDRLGGVIEKASYVFAALIIFGRLIVYFLQPNSMAGFEWMDFTLYLLQTIMIAVTLIVVAVPEGLPMAVTLSLAYSMRRMLQTNNLVRKMHACETMGACSIICTDKTGTLTQNCMTVADAYFPAADAEGADTLSLVHDSMALNSSATLDNSDPANPKPLGNPTEGSLLMWLSAQGVDYRKIREEYEVLGQIPFSTERKYMATIAVNRHGNRMLFVKGAPEIVLDLCQSQAASVPPEDIEKKLAGYQSRAMRTLGFAIRKLNDGESAMENGQLLIKDLTFIGVVAISDPLRQEVPLAVKECLSAGIEVKIVTGDTPGTAKEIARQVGLCSDNELETSQITGSELSSLPEPELMKRLPGIKIISRARPMDKKLLVESLQKLGHVVAVTGDGTNDAPALKAAHVGLSMGGGTSVAKEASDITIIDNSFSSITRAVMWGRSLFQNIQRFILFQLTVNVAACFIVLVGAFTGTESPLTVTQMLWVNLIMDTFAAMALASLPSETSVMRQKPRRREDFIINPAMRFNILTVGGIFFFLLWGLLYIFQHADVACMGDFLKLEFVESSHLSPYELSVFFTVFVFLQFWNLFNAKAFQTGKSAFHFSRCSGFILIATLIIVGQLLIIGIGGEFFNVVPLAATDWLIILAVTFPVLLIGEIVRAFRRA